MSLLLNETSPISKLNRDILWYIFSINADTLGPPVPSRPWKPPSDLHLSPLTITRQSSQVCKAWRSILLASPSIWGNCLHLDLLGQRNDYWRRAVFCRTRHAPLAIRARMPLVFHMRSPVLVFLFFLILNHWKRVKVFDVVLASPSILDYSFIRNAFCGPAPHLKVFSIQHLRQQPRSGYGYLAFDGSDSQLFAGDAPLLAYFSIGSLIISGSSLIPFPSIFLTGRLQHLTLEQPLCIPAPYLLAACAQMPLLETLSLNIENLMMPKLQGPNPASFAQPPPISLPNLISIRICALSLDIFPGFLGRTVPRFGCKWDISIPGVPGGITKLRNNTSASADEIQATIVRYVSNFFAANDAVPSLPTHLHLYLALDDLCLATADQAMRSLADAGFYIRFRGFDIPFIRLFAQALCSLNYPPSFRQLQFIPEFPYPRLFSAIPSLLPFFLALESITELYTTLGGLSYIIAQSQTERYILFMALHTVLLMGAGACGTVRDVLHSIKPFFANRQHTSPIAVLNITDFMAVRADLRPLEEVAGLRVIWRDADSRSGPIEYVCGSGSAGKRKVLPKDD